MPRFTIGSLATGVALFVLVLALWTAYGQRTRAMASARATTTPDGRLAVVNVDPRTGRPAIDGPSDLDLEDAFPWDGGLTAATW